MAGYIADPDDSVGPLFDWYFNGDTELSARPSGWTLAVSPASFGYVQPFWDAIKVTVIGRPCSTPRTAGTANRPRGTSWSSSPTVWVPRTLSCHATCTILVDEAAEPVSSQRPDGRAGGSWECRLRAGADAVIGAGGGCCEVGPGRGSGLSTGPFPRTASRTRRATFTATGSP